MSIIADPTRQSGEQTPILPDLLSPEARSHRFARICEQAMQERRNAGDAGIGTLAEKWQHQIIKRYLTEDPAQHEVKLEPTRFVSDVRVGDHVYEVQTGRFSAMQKKIGYYLEQTDLTVTVVHPIPKNRTVCWIDPDSMEISQPKPSPKHGKPTDLLPELYGLLPYLTHPRLNFRILLLEVRDFRILSQNTRNRKRGAVRFERIPIRLLQDIRFSSSADLASLLPEGLPETFTVRSFSQLSKLKGRDAYSAVHALEKLGILIPAPAINRAMAFSLSQPK